MVLNILIALAALLILASSLTGLELQPGKPLPLSWDQVETPQGIAPVPGGELLYNIFRFFYFATWIIVAITLIYMLISPKYRKVLLRELVRMIPFIIFIAFLLYLFQNIARNNLMEGEEGVAITMPMALGTPYPMAEAEFQASTSSWVVWLASLGFAILILLVVSVLIWYVWRKRRRPGPVEEAESVLEEAQNALDAIHAGEDLKSVVLRCYYDMSKVISEQRGIKRGVDVTPQEFQDRLEEKGLPREPVRQLTQLFQDVRYGSRTPGKLEENQAVASLTAIVQALRG